MTGDVRHVELDMKQQKQQRHQRQQQGSYPCFTNVDCPYFPCHDDVDPAAFNCLFCYCPLYPLGAECGGDFTYTDLGYKDCSTCSLPHVRDVGTRLVMSKYPLLASMAFDPEAARAGQSSKPCRPKKLERLRAG